MGSPDAIIGLMDDIVRIAGIAGSLRKRSYNRAALLAAKNLAPAGAVIEVVEIGTLPLFNDDLASAPPPAVTEFRRAIGGADAILFSTPEYNYSISGVLKNAIDWGSRPPAESVWARKPAAIMGASGGLLGTARAQYHLRQMFVFLDMYPLNRPEVMIASAGKKFDAQGSLTDDDTRRRIGELVQALVTWTKQLRRAFAP